ncbi:foldase protein prsa precursor [hydrocarbon metagenome]|uniref:peptidylprolyl isomerase n=1 Tax=hydrocarbon metagenome TaxID=938273 RepID=A0A0W8E7X0_9ZZZZ
MKNNTILLLVMVAVLFLAGCSNTPSAEEYAGDVNGVKITQAEYQQRYELLQASYKMQQESYSGVVVEEIPADVLKDLETRAFDDIVYQKLLITEAQGRGIEVIDEELDHAINEFKDIQLQGDAASYTKFLQKTGLDEEKFRFEMKMELLISKLQDEVAANVTVSEEEVTTYYEENKSMYTQAAGIRIYHILVDNEELALEILGKLNSGSDFSQLAQEYSTCSSASQGGDLGIVNETTSLVPEFLTAALKLEPGQITQEPVKTEFGYHIIKAGDRQEESIQDFASVKNSILLQLQQEKELTTFNDFVEGLKNEADITDYRDKK